jgi:hypothetical protein
VAVADYKNKKYEKLQIPIFADPQADSTHYNIQKILADEKGRIYLVDINDGIYIYTPEGADVEGCSTCSYMFIQKMYPNPSSDRIQVTLHLNNMDLSDFKAEIYDERGNLVKTLTDMPTFNDRNGEASFDFSVSDLSGGAYFLGISSGKSKKLKLFAVTK